MFKNLAAPKKQPDKEYKRAHWLFTLDRHKDQLHAFKDFVAGLEKNLADSCDAKVSVRPTSPKTTALISAEIHKDASKRAQRVRDFGAKVKALIKLDIKVGKRVPGRATLACLETGEAWDIKRTTKDVTWEKIAP